MVGQVFLLKVQINQLCTLEEMFLKTKSLLSHGFNNRTTGIGSLQPTHLDIHFLGGSGSC